MQLLSRHSNGDLQSIDDTGNVTEDSEQDTDKEVGAATTLKEYTKRRKEDGEDDLADVTVTNRDQLRGLDSVRGIRGIGRRRNPNIRGLDLRCCERHCCGC